jgi:hypothetical protein
MSDPVRVALVAEGPTDGIVIEAALLAMMGDREFVLTQLQPEGSVAFGHLGTGWVGVYRWCRQAASRGGGRLSGDALLFGTYDVVVLHVDADVAAKKYSEGAVEPQATDGELPCERTCPPASATTNVLRTVLLSWCGESTVPAGSVVCIPSKSTDAWVIATLFPGDPAMRTGIECRPDPEARLGLQRKGDRIKKTQRDYRARASQISSSWPRIARQGVCGEAHRFETEFRGALPPPSDLV